MIEKMGKVFCGTPDPLKADLLQSRLARKTCLLRRPGMNRVPHRCSGTPKRVPSNRLPRLPEPSSRIRARVAVRAVSKPIPRPRSGPSRVPRGCYRVVVHPRTEGGSDPRGPPPRADGHRGGQAARRGFRRPLDVSSRPRTPHCLAGHPPTYRSVLLAAHSRSRIVFPRPVGVPGITPAHRETFPG